MQAPLLLMGVLGFASGILCRSLFVFPWHALALLPLIAFACVALYALKRSVVYLGACAFLLFAMLGIGRVMLMPAALPEPFVPLLETKVSLEGVVVGDPDIRETSQRVPVEIERSGVATRVLAVAPLHPEVRYGERVRIEGTFALPEPFETDTGRTFRYDRFLAKDGIFALVEFASLESVAPPDGIVARTRGALYAAKHAFQDALAYALPEPGASLASGLITGGEQGLGEELLQAFIVTGLVHIVVLSGYNVMIIAEGVLRSLAFLPRRMAALIAGLVIGLFVLAAGAGAASIRAGLMAGLALVARATGRTYAVVRALLFAGALMLLINPLLLAYDPGFQLSFAATLGLILLAPRVEGWFAWMESAFWRDLIAATLAAQVAVLPLLLYQTGLFSLVSLPANLLVLPFVPFAMALSAVAGLAGLIMPALAPVVGFPAHLLLSVIITLTEFLASLPLASVSIPEFPFALVLIVYGALALWIANAPVRSRGRVRQA